MNEVKRFKPVRIDVFSFVKRFKGREVKLLKGYNSDGSRRVTNVTIVGFNIHEGREYCMVVEPKVGTYYCFPEWLIHSGNDFSR